MPFLAAVVAILTILLLVLLATCAHILARVMRLEQAERARAATEIIPGVGELRVGTQLPRDVLGDIGARDGRVLSLHIVSAGCSSCREFIDGFSRNDRRGDEGMHRVVVGHDADRALLTGLDGIDVAVSGALVQSTIVSGWELPVTVRVDGDTVVAIEPVGANR
jgi:hypothetical protein